jgi:hypothetical protein
MVRKEVRELRIDVNGVVISTPEHVSSVYRAKYSKLAKRCNKKLKNNLFSPFKIEIKPGG